MRRTVVALFAALALYGLRAESQFFAPLPPTGKAIPRPSAADSQALEVRAAAIADSLSVIDRRVRALELDLEQGRRDSAAFEEATETAYRRLREYQSLIAQPGAVSSDTSQAVAFRDSLRSLETRRDSIVKRVSRLATERSRWQRVREGLQNAYRAVGPAFVPTDRSTSRLFASIGAGFRRDQMYVVSTPIAGRHRGFIIEISDARVVSAVDTGLPLEKRKEIRDRIAAFTKILNNGGAQTFRSVFVVPSYDTPHPWLRPLLYALSHRGEGWATQLDAAASMGRLGETEVDSTGDQYSVGALAEWQLSFDITQLLGDAIIANGYVGVRRGFQNGGGKAIVGGINDRKLYYTQVAFGIKQNNVVAFGVTVNYLPDVFKPLVPRVFITASANSP